MKPRLRGPPDNAPVSQQVISEAIDQKAYAIPTHMFAFIVEVKVLVFDLRDICLQAVSEVSNKAVWHAHFCNRALICFFDWLFVSLLVHQIDETLVPVQRNLFLEMAARCIHLNDRFSPQKKVVLKARSLQSLVGP